MDVDCEWWSLLWGRCDGELNSVCWFISLSFRKEIQQYKKANMSFNGHHDLFLHKWFQSRFFFPSVLTHLGLPKRLTNEIAAAGKIANKAKEVRSCSSKEARFAGWPLRLLFHCRRTKRRMPSSRMKRRSVKTNVAWRNFNILGFAAGNPPYISFGFWTWTFLPVLGDCHLVFFLNANAFLHLNRDPKKMWKPTDHSRFKKWITRFERHLNLHSWHHRWLHQWVGTFPEPQLIALPC